MKDNAETKRLREAKSQQAPWKKWGPYLSERQWGTVREDYSANGDAWNYFPHDHARSRAYRWGEDGLAGICDDHQVLCFSLALWNGRDPIIKERLFGLTNGEGNHGEDVKEYYFYLDSTPTHSYMKYLYKYPQAAYPYADLVETNRRRDRNTAEYELLDTGVFDGDRYFDVFVEYAKADVEDILIRITACNRGTEAAPLHVLPTLLFRNTWSWAGGGTKPTLRRVDQAGRSVIHASHSDALFQKFIGDYYLVCDGDVPLLFTENETNHERLFGTPNASPYVKDGINNYFIRQQPEAVNPQQTGTKASPHYAMNIAAGASQTIRLRLSRTAPEASDDIEFLKYAFSKLLVNFTWWVNRKDRNGNNVFEGGFLGLDNIGVFDRSSPLPTGGFLEQADGTAWMVFYSQQMLRIAVELALHEPLYEEFVSKFFQHTMWIAGAMDRLGEHADEMWDEQDGFFYDVLRLPDGQSIRLKVRSLVGLLPLVAVAVFDEDILERLPRFRAFAQDFLTRHPELAINAHMPATPGVNGRRMLSIVNEDKLRRILGRMLDENEFFSPYGIRSLSRFHREHPFVFAHNGQESRVDYVPGDSNSGMFGGNSNWRGPVWMPVNSLIQVSLFRLYAYYGDDFTIECPTGSGKSLTLFDVAMELGERLTRIFLQEPQSPSSGMLGRRPVNGAATKFTNDPHWRNLVLFYEYFHGDCGAGVGASHQTGWTGCIARVIQTTGLLTKEMLLHPDAERLVMKAGTGKK